MDLGIYASDVWTIKRLTLSPGCGSTIECVRQAQNLDSNAYTPGELPEVKCVPC